jgi:hypothetical protein
LPGPPPLRYRAIAKALADRPPLPRGQETQETMRSTPTARTPFGVSSWDGPKPPYRPQASGTLNLAVVAEPPTADCHARPAVSRSNRGFHEGPGHGAGSTVVTNLLPTFDDQRMGIRQALCCPSTAAARGFLYVQGRGGSFRPGASWSPAPAMATTRLGHLSDRQSRIVDPIGQLKVANEVERRWLTTSHCRGISALSSTTRR